VKELGYLASRPKREQEFFMNVKTVNISFGQSIVKPDEVIEELKMVE